MAIRVYIKTYNYHELNANYHKLILFSYSIVLISFLLLHLIPVLVVVIVAHFDVLEHGDGIVGEGCQ